MNRFLKTNAWLAAAHSVIFLIIGYNLLTSKPTSLQAPLTLFAILLLVLGGLALVFGFFQKKHHQQWWQVALLSIIDIALGGIVLFNTQGTAVIYIKLIALFAFLTGISLAWVAYKSERFKALIGINSAISIGFGIILFFNPDMGSFDLLPLVGLYTLILAFFLAYLSWWMYNRKIEIISNTKLDNLSE